ncbi:integral membrane protein DUF92-domain-containing protein [Auriculariales sp. MPI-PUGE-AT-0066]|nr:integral membrane protein DUF92-domain-containing protein [Auriculariales sp. MPI-PUGE-AT-0066]
MALTPRTLADHVIAALVAITVARRAYKRQSLSTSGAIAAVVVGYITLHMPTKAFGIAMLVFFFAASKATKTGKELKARLEDGHAEAGNRTAWQVFCNSFPAAIAALLWEFLAPKYMPSRRCPTNSPYGQYGREFVFAALAQFACCLGDTLASELGILSSSWPILITTFRRVPPGTNGGLSAMGTAASCMGGLLIGASFALVFSIESSACRDQLATVWLECCGWGAASGLIGSVIDSLLGATLQRTRYDDKKKLILQDDAPEHRASKVISGFHILSNNQVNFISGLITALLVGYLA